MCQKENLKDKPVCAECWRILPRNLQGCIRCARFPCDCVTLAGLGVHRLFAPFVYEGKIRESIHQLKFFGKLGHGTLLGQLWIEALFFEVLKEKPDLIVPMPLARHKLRERGYNQVFGFARYLGKRLEIPVAAVAECQIATLPQRLLNQQERAQNVRGVFTMGSEVKGKHIVLCDDVCTTGATLASLTTAAYSAGAARVSWWVIAHARFA